MAKHPALAQQLDLQPGLLANLAHRRSIRQLVRVDMPAGRQPHTKLAVVQQQCAPFMDDKCRRGEITREARPKVVQKSVRQNGYKRLRM